MKIIIINATAAHSSGALTILKDFMSHVYTLNDVNITFHLLTTTNNTFQTFENILVHELPLQNWRSRLLWDRKGLQKWCENNNIIPDVAISLQNTCARFTGKYSNVKWLVYYHQPLPLIKYPWKCLKKEECKLFLYAHFYKFFVNRWNKNAEYVVQLPYIKQMFCNKFKNISSERIHVIRPNLPKIDIDSIVSKDIGGKKKVFIFPATPLEYKNHKVILNAVELLKKQDEKLSNKIKIIFTVPSESHIAINVRDRGLESIVNCIGSIPYEVLLTYYKGCDGLLFPSKIESFGLPLVEAAMFGVPVIASDLPYAREVLAYYEGSAFANADIAEQWAEEIKKIIFSEKRYTPLSQKSENTWDNFMQLL